MHTRLDYIEKETSVLLRKKKYFEHHIKRVKNDEDKEKLFWILFAITIQMSARLEEYMRLREEVITFFNS